MTDEKKPEEKKWNMEKIRQEVYDARTKMFVVAKVLETGSIKPSEHPEWVLVIRSLINDLVKNSERVTQLLGDEEVLAEGETNQQTQ